MMEFRSDSPNEAPSPEGYEREEGRLIRDDGTMKKATSDSWGDEKSTSGDDKKPKAKKREFPWKLHTMLDKMEEENKEHIISWGYDGTSFKVHNPEQFVSDIMSTYFNQSQYRSFQKMVSYQLPLCFYPRMAMKLISIQLNLYNFEKIMGGPMKGGYFHPMFRRDDKERCLKMKIRPKKDSNRPTGLPDASYLRRIGILRGDTSPSQTFSHLAATQQMALAMGDSIVNQGTDLSPLIHPLLHQQRTILEETKETSLPTLMRRHTVAAMPPMPQASETDFWRSSSVPDSFPMERNIYHHSNTPLFGEEFGTSDERVSSNADSEFQRPLSDDLEPRHFPPPQFWE